jgi:hypothetical protein
MLCETQYLKAKTKKLIFPDKRTQSVSQIIKNAAENALHCSKQTLEQYLKENWLNITEHEDQPIDLVSSDEAKENKDTIELLSSSSQDVVLLSKK